MIAAVESADGLMAVAAGFGLNNGDRLPEPFRSLPFPSTAFRSDPLRLRGDLDCISCAALPVVGEFATALDGPASRTSPSLVRRILRRDRRLPDMERLCDVGDFLFSNGLGVSSSILGNGMAESFSFSSDVGVLIVLQRSDERHGGISW